MSKNVFPMVNAWISKKPVKYWRAFTPKDIPLDNDERVFYWEWNNILNKWSLGFLSSTQRNWNYNAIQHSIKIHNRLIESGKHETAIVEVHPQFEIGKYKNNIEILNIYSENVRFYEYDHTYKIWPTEYYIKHNNQCDIVTETTLYEMINKNNHCYIYSFRKNDNTNLFVRSNTNNPKNERNFIKEVLSKPGFKFHFEKHPSFSYNSKNAVWKYIKTDNISKKVWQETKNSKPTTEYMQENGAFNMHFTFREFKKYYEGQVAKIKSASIRDDLDLAFLKAVQTNSTKTASFKNQVSTSSSVKSPDLKENPKNSKREKGSFVYIIYGKNKKGEIIKQKCLKEFAERLQEKHPKVEIMTIPDFNKQELSKFERIKKEPVKPTGMNRKTRRYDKQKHKRYNRNVKTQYISIPIKEVEKHPKLAKEQWSNKNGHIHKPFFLTNTISSSVIKVNGKLVERDSMKPIYHYVPNKKSAMTKHNAKKTNLSMEDRQLLGKYSPYDRRYNKKSSVETWSTLFFEVLKMVKAKERHKKIISILMDKGGYTRETAEGILKYLQLTKNGNPAREHKRNRPVLVKRIMVTKPHLQINSPDPNKSLVIEHEVSNEEEGGVKNIITENVNVRYSKKQGLRFFKYNEETNDNIEVATAKTLKKWAYVQEYKEDPNKTNWQQLLIVTSKETPKVVRQAYRIERRVKGGRVKKWSTPIPVEKTAKYLIKKLIAVYKEENYELLYSIIRNRVMEDRDTSAIIYNAVRKTLYHHYSDISKRIVTLIKANKMDDPDLVIFMEDLLHHEFTK